MNDKKRNDLIIDTYRELFKAAGGDFDTLLANATINELGQKQIPFMYYELPAEQFEQILDSQIAKFKVPKYLIQTFRNEIHLGCSPRTV